MIVIIFIITITEQAVVFVNKITAITEVHEEPEKEGSKFTLFLKCFMLFSTFFMLFYLLFYMYFRLDAKCITINQTSKNC
jgi:hypothetical protein